MTRFPGGGTFEPSTWDRNYRKNSKQRNKLHKGTEVSSLGRETGTGGEGVGVVTG